MTPRERRFVEEYVIDSNGAQAAIRAGYSARSAKEIAAEVLTRPHVVAAIDKLRAEVAKKAEWTAVDILHDLREIATCRDNDMSSRLRAYELAGKHLGMYKDRVDHTVSAINVVFDIPRPVPNNQ